MACTAQHERLFTIEGLFACFNNLTSTCGVVTADRYVNLNATDSINDAYKALKIQLGIVRDGYAGKFRDNIDDIARISHRVANAIGSVDLLISPFTHVDEGIAVNGYQRYLFIAWINTSEHDGVASIGAFFGTILVAVYTILAFINTKKEHVERLTIFNLREAGSNGRVYVRNTSIDVCDVGKCCSTYTEDKNKNNDKNNAQFLETALAFTSA